MKSSSTHDGHPQNRGYGKHRRSKNANILVESRLKVLWNVIGKAKISSAVNELFKIFIRYESY